VARLSATRPATGALSVDVFQQMRGSIFAWDLLALCKLICPALYDMEKQCPVAHPSFARPLKAPVFGASKTDNVYHLPIGQSHDLPKTAVLCEPFSDCGL
jgi:hypothetical protein